MNRAENGHFTIIGGHGFVGSNLAAALARKGRAYYLPAKGDLRALSGELGNVLFCAGTTSDFRQRPFDTVNAHVGLLSYVLEHCDFTSLTYLSSTRVYIHAASTNEDATIPVVPSDAGDLFNLSKLTGEALCRQSGRHGVRAVRLSNVLGDDYGSNNFAFSLMRDARSTGRIRLQTALESAKDYIRIDDAVDLILAISQRGIQMTYNVATGYNLTNADVTASICRGISAVVTVEPNAPRISFAPIEVSRIVEEFGYSPKSVAAYLTHLATLFPAVPA